MATDWPDSLKPASVRFTPVTGYRRGAPTLLGITQATSGDAGAWTASLNNIPVVRSEQVLKLRAALIRCVARADSMLISPYDGCRSATASNGTASGGNLRDTTMSISGSSIQEGNYFEVDNRLYCAYGVNGSTVNFWPPRRSTGGGTANLINPRCHMRLTPESEQALETNWTNIQFISLQFEESREV
jgi:hypothetical protein